jgi:2-polyprenyl-6-methoxyphenol hydroxylase-like FAD-dependent oxidoreductase
MMIRLFAISGAAPAGAFAAILLATAVAAQDATTDIGTLDKETAEKAFPAKPPYSP